MSEGILTDLDELVMEVRDRTSRVYLQEAVAAYRGKALRAAVVATWLAVVFDIISKMRELANQGDAAAREQVQKIDNAIAGTDFRAMQNIENSLLELAKSPFEFLTEREAKDLDRLRDDRNHSAHPAFVQPGAMFAPTPDLVRSHIVHAANHLLRHPPVQGKSALARIKNDLLQPSFPSDRERAIQYFASKYLNHVRQNLIETLVTVFVKAIVAQTDKDLIGREQAMGHCLAAIARDHSVVYDRVLREQLKHLTDGVDDETLLRVFEILPTDPQCWTRLEEPVRLRMTEMIDKFGRADSDPFAFGKSPDPSPLLHGLVVPELKGHVERLIRRLSTDVQAEFIARNPRPELGDIAVQIFGAARSFRGAESLARRVLVPMGSSMMAEHVVSALAAAQKTDMHELTQVMLARVTWFHRKGLPEKLSIIAQKLNQPIPLADSLLSINAVRNCLVHRQGVVTVGLDCEDGATLSLKWQKPEFVVTSTDGAERIMDGPTVVKAGESVAVRVVQTMRSFSPGWRLTFSTAELAEICFTLFDFCAKLQDALETFARDHGLELRGQPIKAKGGQAKSARRCFCLFNFPTKPLPSPQSQ